MRYTKDQILYFKPSYSLKIKYCRICQIVKYLEKKKQYLVIAHDIYCPCHYTKSFVYEDDLDDINNTFLVNEYKVENLYINLTLEEVLKLNFYDLYTEVKINH